MAAQAGIGRCEEASTLSGASYIPCNAPAEQMVGFQNQDGSWREGPYRMCGPCAHHNLTNRGAKHAGPYEGEVGPVLGNQPDLTAEDLAAYADAAQPVVNAEDLLASITRTVRELREARDDVKRAEEVLKVAQGRVRVLEETTLPELMTKAGQQKLRTIDGWDVELGETLRASIPVAHLPEAIKWLRDHNHGSLVKRELKLDFGMNEEEKAVKALTLILEAGFTPTDKQYVHPMSLASAIRQMLEQGTEVPMGLLGAHVQPQVKVREPKKK